MLPLEVVRFVLPLETLPFWPEAPTPSALVVLGVIIGIPVGFTLLITLLVKVGDLTRSYRVGGYRGPGGFWVNPGREPLPPCVDVSDDDSPYTTGEREALIRAARRAEQSSGLDVSIFVGPTDHGRDHDDYAIDLFETLSDPERSVLVSFDPTTRLLEFVTGDEADETISADDLATARVAAEAEIAEDRDVLGLVRAVELLVGGTDRGRALPTATEGAPARALGH